MPTQPVVDSPTRPSRAGARVRPRVPAPRLSGPAWLVWRQHRAAFWTGAVLALAVVVYMLWRRAELLADVHAYESTVCRGKSECMPWLDREDQRLGDLLHETALALTWVPVLVGTFVGGPLLARELEAGTHRLMWSQSVGQGRWLAAKLGVPTLVTMACTGTVGAAYTWWWLSVQTAAKPMWPESQLWQGMGDYDRWAFVGAVGPVVAANALLALVLGAVAGLLVRRTVPAMAVALAVTTGARFGLYSLRSRLLPRVTRIGPITEFHAPRNGLDLPPHAWYLNDGFVTASGHRVPNDTCLDAVDWDACSAKAGLVRRYVVYQPESHFWPIQWAEAGVCVAVAAALAAFCLWWIRRLPA